MSSHGGTHGTHPKVPALRAHISGDTGDAFQAFHPGRGEAVPLRTLARIRGTTMRLIRATQPGVRLSQMVHGKSLMCSRSRPSTRCRLQVGDQLGQLRQDQFTNFILISHDRTVADEQPFGRSVASLRDSSNEFRAASS